MNRQAKMRRGKFYRWSAGALMLAVSATRARLPATGVMIIRLRDWEVDGGPWTAEEASERWPQYKPDDLVSWSTEAMILGARRYWEPMPACEVTIKVQPATGQTMEPDEMSKESDEQEATAEKTK